MEAETVQIAPTGQKKTYGRIACPECGAAFTATHHRQSFCSSAHQKAYNDRAKIRGASIYMLAMAHRQSRNSKAAKETGAWARTTMCRMLDDWAAEDKKENRIPALKLFERQRVMGERD